MTRHEYEQNLATLARDAFAKHEIRERSEGRWLLFARRPSGGWDGHYWTEVISLAGGRVLAHGDIETVVFAGYSGEGGVEGPVRWIGKTTRGDFRYLGTKAAIGTGPEGIETTDVDVCAGMLGAWARERFADFVAERFGDPWFAFDDGEEEDGLRIFDVLRWVCALTDALELAEDGKIPDVARVVDAFDMLDGGDPVESVRIALYESGEEEGEFVFLLGAVVDARVFYAHAACVRLVELLDAERAALPQEAKEVHGG